MESSEEYVDFPDDYESQLGEAFTQAVRVHLRAMSLIDGVVKSVEYPESQTCTVTVGEGNEAVDFNKVALRVLFTSLGAFTEVPAVGSKCIICFRDGNLARRQLFAVDTCDKLLLNYGSIEANGGKNGGLVNVMDLVERLNLVENDINKLKTAFDEWIVVPNDGGAALRASAAGWAASPLSETTRQEIEDTKFTH